MNSSEQVFTEKTRNESRLMESQGRTRPPGRSTGAVKARSISMTYPVRGNPPVSAIDDVTIDVRPGEFVSIVGPSGCGKSTLLKIIAGLIRPSAGRIYIDDTEVRRPSRSVGYVFQAPVLLPWRTVRQNVTLPADLVHSPRSESHAMADALLALVGLSGREDTSPTALSGGMQQRVGIARALAQNPAVLLMDEPFGALDAMTRDQMGLELLRIWAHDQKTVLFVTHSIPEAVLLSDRALVMSPQPGRIIESFTIEIPRPRQAAAVASPQFNDYVLKIRTLLNANESVF